MRSHVHDGPPRHSRPHIPDHKNTSGTTGKNDVIEHAALRERRLEIVAELARGLLGGASVHEVLEKLADPVCALADADLVLVTLPEGTHRIVDTASGLDVGLTLVLPISTADDRVRAVLEICRRAGREPFEPCVREAVGELGFDIARVLELADRRLDDERLRLYQDRERIARDLHDLVVQRLFGVCMGLAGLRNLSQDTDVTARVTKSIDELDDTIRQIRSTIFELHAEEVAAADAPLRHRVIREVDAARQILGFPAALRMEGLIDTDVPPYVGQHVIAVLREALANVARHAQARWVEVDIVVNDHVTIEIADDGLGPPDSVPRSGLDNLARRAEQLAGQFTVEPANPHGTGTRIRWSVPLR